MINFKIDQITPCLKSTQTGEIFETEVIRIRRKSFLQKFNKRTGWHIDWSKFSDGVEIYALVLKGTIDIQGLIAIEYDEDAKAVHIVWACTAPHNNVWKHGKQKYVGVGGHLFAIASELSVQKGYDGVVYGEASDQEVYKHYVEKYHARSLPSLNKRYRFMLTEGTAKTIREVYEYEWTEMDCMEKRTRNSETDKKI